MALPTSPGDCQSRWSIDELFVDAICKQYAAKCSGLSLSCPTQSVGCLKHHAIIAFFAISDNRAKVNKHLVLYSFSAYAKSGNELLSKEQKKIDTNG